MSTVTTLNSNFTLGNLEYSTPLVINQTQPIKITNTFNLSFDTSTYSIVFFKFDIIDSTDTILYTTYKEFSNGNNSFIWNCHRVSESSLKLKITNTTNVSVSISNLTAQLENEDMTPIYIDNNLTLINITKSENVELSNFFLDNNLYVNEIVLGEFDSIVSEFDDCEILNHNVSINTDIIESIDSSYIVNMITNNSVTISVETHEVSGNDIYIDNMITNNEVNISVDASVVTGNDIYINNTIMNNEVILSEQISTYNIT